MRGIGWCSAVDLFLVLLVFSTKKEYLYRNTWNDFQQVGREPAMLATPKSCCARRPSHIARPCRGWSPSPP